MQNTYKKMIINHSIEDECELIVADGGSGIL